MNGKRSGSCQPPPTPPLAKRACQPQPPPLSCGPQQDPQRLNQLHKPPQPFGDVSSPVRVTSSSPAEISGGPQHLNQFLRPRQLVGGYSCGTSSSPEEFHGGPQQVPQPFNQFPRPPQPFNQFHIPPQPFNQFHIPPQPFNQFHRTPQPFGDFMYRSSSSPEELSGQLSPWFDLRDRLDVNGFYAKAMLIDFAYDLFRRLVRVGICPDVPFESRVELERTVNQFLFARWKKENLPLISPVESDQGQYTGAGQSFADDDDELIGFYFDHGCGGEDLPLQKKQRIRINSEPTQEGSTTPHATVSLAPAANNGKVGISPAAEHSQKVDIAEPFKEQNHSVVLVSHSDSNEEINSDIAKPDKTTRNDTSSASTPAPNLSSPRDTMPTTLASKKPLKDIATMTDLKPTQSNKQTMTGPPSLKTSWTMTPQQGSGPATFAAQRGIISKTSADPAKRKPPAPPVPRKIKRGKMLTDMLEKKETGTSTDFVHKTDAETCTDVIQNNDADTMTKEVEQTERGTLTAVTTSHKTTSTDPTQLSWAENVSLVDIAPRARSENETQTETTQIMTKSLPLETNIVDNSSRGTQELEGGTDCPNHSSLDQGTSESIVRISFNIKIGKGLNARVV